jgi:hypothetical protein
VPQDHVIPAEGKDQLQQQILEYLRQTPIAVGVLVMSFFSGQLWAFIITAFIRTKTRGNRLIESFWGRMAMGILWFTAISVPMYLWRFGNYEFEYGNLVRIAIPTMVTGMLAQIIIFALFGYFGGRR